MWAFAIFLIYWLLLSLLALYFVKQAFKHHANQPSFPVPAHYQAFMRKDFGKWDYAQIQKGCFLRFPLKVTLLIGYLANLILLIFLKRYINFPDRLITWWRNYIGLLSMKLNFELIEHFDRNQKLTAPITISNHVSWFDFYYLNSCFRLHSPVSKIQVQKVFGFNIISQYGQSLYVDRNATSGRHNIVEGIKNRVKEFQNAKDDSVNPILIFPEGTVSDGRSLMSFKNGAFQNLTPITIFSLRYECKQFHMGMDQINAFYYTIIAMCLNPKLIVKKKVVNPEVDETVDTYRERCRSIIAEMGGFAKIDSSFRDLMDYQKMKKQAKRKK